MAPNHSFAAGGGTFPATRWSVVAAVRSADAAERSRALEALCAAYWKPVYKYIRLKFSKSPADSQDLTQGFFVELLDRELLARFEPDKSRLRTYLRLCVDSFVINEIRHAGRIKRGGEVTHVALDFAAAETELNAQTIDPASIPSPQHFEEFFEKEWIRGLFSAAVEELKQICTARNKQSAFALFESYDLSDETDISYAQLGAANNISGTEVTNQLAWARREFRRLAQERLRALCPSDDEYQREARALFGGNGGWGF
jgi:RNA polymerase sigma factor (sigma-70 family)